MVDDPAPKNPSPRRTARRSASGCPPASQIGGCGDWTGLGSIAPSATCQKRPSKSIRGSVQQARISASPSVNRPTNVAGSTSNAAKARYRPPLPRPTSIRPRLSWSRVAMLLARWSGLWRVETSTAQPRRMRSEQAAA